MATTSIDTRRNSAAFQKYYDAVFIRDDKKLYFGNGGDVSLEYDEDGNDVLNYAGAALHMYANAVFRDEKQLHFGTDADMKLYYHAASDCLTITGLSDQKPAAGGAIYTSDMGTGIYLKVSTRKT